MFIERRQTGELSYRTAGLLELSQEVAARTVLRVQVPPSDPASPERYETRLRAVGAELDAEPAQAYELVVTRRTIVVEGSAGYYRVCTAEGLAPQLRKLVTQRQETNGNAAEQ